VHFKYVHRNQRLLLCYLLLITHIRKVNIHPQCCFHDLLVFIMNYQGCLTFLSREARHPLSGNTELSLCKSSSLSSSSIEPERKIHSTYRQKGFCRLMTATLPHRSGCITSQQPDTPTHMPHEAIPCHHMVGLDDLRGLFQPMITKLQDNQSLHRASTRQGLNLHNLLNRTAFSLF